MYKNFIINTKFCINLMLSYGVSLGELLYRKQVRTYFYLVDDFSR